MLILSRKEGEVVKIGEATVTVQRIRGQRGNLQVVLGIEAPDDVLILRGELADKENQEQADGEDPDGAGGESAAAGR